MFREGDRREAELCLYTGWIVLETTIQMVVLLLLLCHCIGNLDLECHFGAQIRIVGVDLVELNGKRSIFGIETTTNR